MLNQCWQNVFSQNWALTQEWNEASLRTFEISFMRFYFILLCPFLFFIWNCSAAEKKSIAANRKVVRSISSLDNSMNIVISRILTSTLVTPIGKNITISRTIWIKKSSKPESRISLKTYIIAFFYLVQLTCRRFVNSWCWMTSGSTSYFPIQDSIN